MATFAFLFCVTIVALIIWAFVTIETESFGTACFSCVVTWLVVAALGWGAVALFSSDMQPAGATSRQASQYLGLTSGKSYPVELGRSVDGSVGSVKVSAHGGLFGSSAVTYIDVQPGSPIAMGFQTSDGFSILQVPMNKVRQFKRATNHAPTVTFYLDNVRENGYGAGQTCRSVWDGIVLHGSCSDSAIKPSNSLKHTTTLASIVQEHLKSVTIELPASTYQKLLGTP